MLLARGHTAKTVVGQNHMEQLANVQTTGPRPKVSDASVGEAGAFPAGAAALGREFSSPG